MNGYVILSRHFDFDGDIMIETEGYNAPSKLYLNYDKAVEDHKRLTIEFFETEDISSYAESIPDLISDAGRKKVNELIPLLSVHREASYEEDTEDHLEFFKIVKTLLDVLSLEQKMSIINELYLRPYEIHEIPLVT